MSKHAVLQELEMSIKNCIPTSISFLTLIPSLNQICFSPQNQNIICWGGGGGGGDTFLLPFHVQLFNYTKFDSISIVQPYQV